MTSAKPIQKNLLRINLEKFAETSLLILFTSYQTDIIVFQSCLTLGYTFQFTPLDLQQMYQFRNMDFIEYFNRIFR